MQYDKYVKIDSRMGGALKIILVRARIHIPKIVTTIRRIDDVGCSPPFALFDIRFDLSSLFSPLLSVRPTISIDERITKHCSCLVFLQIAAKTSFSRRG